MTSPLLAFLIKLPLALIVFLLIAYTGTVSRRIAGVLLTFPILNGIAVIAGTDPIAVADAIYPLVIFNCVLFALLISFPRLLSVDALPPGARLLLRVAAWSALWFAGAYLVTDARAQLPGATVLLIGASLFAPVFMLLSWSRAKDAEPAPRATWSYHRQRFAWFWRGHAGLWRIALFTLAYICLFLVSRAALDEKWVGMASALPLPGFFALAVLMDEPKPTATAASGSSALLAIRDTVFLGPILVIPFNWTFSHLIVSAAPATPARYLLLFALWALAAIAVLFLVPPIAAYFDR